jgi:uncharacterized protein
MSDDPAQPGSLRSGDRLLERLLAFVAELRRAGVPATQSEAIDAMRMVAELDLLDRAQLREGLAAVTVTAPNQRRAFDDLFELYFPARQVLPSDRFVTDDPPDEVDRDTYLHELLDRLEAGDEEAIRELARLAV